MCNGNSFIFVTIFEIFDSAPHCTQLIPTNSANTWMYYRLSAHHTLSYWRNKQVYPCRNMTLESALEPSYLIDIFLNSRLTVCLLISTNPGCCIFCGIFTKCCRSDNSTCRIFPEGSRVCTKYFCRNGSRIVCFNCIQILFWSL